MDALAKYKKLPSPFRHQLGKLLHHYSSDENVKHQNKWLLYSFTKEGGDLTPGNKKRLFKYAVFVTLNPRLILDSKFVSATVCYSADGRSINLVKVIKSGKHAVVLEGYMNEYQPLIIKWYQSSKRDCSYEAGVYSKLKALGCPLAGFDTNFKYWEKPILVLEKLQPLNQFDNEYRVGCDVINQLKYLNTFAVHADIKYQNLMKRVTSVPVKTPERTVYENKIEYLLIDFGGVAMERLGEGWRRWVWSPKYTSSKAHVKDQVCTAKNDFIELGYAMKIIQNWRHTKGMRDGEFKSGYKGKLAKYMKRVDAIDQKNITMKDYDDLIAILNEGE